MVESELQESVIHINRVAKVVKGGRNFAFTALVAVGDGNGSAGIGYGKGSEVPLAIQKAIENAKKDIHQIPMAGSTIVHTITGEHGSSKVLLKPASPGTGIIAGGPVRAVCEVLGVKDIVAKSMGTSNAHNVIRATMKALLKQSSPKQISAVRNKKISEIIEKRG